MPPHSTIDGAAAAEELLRRELQRRIAEQRLELPMLPQTATDVLSLCNDTSCDTARLAVLIQRDQALAAHTLHISNSAVYAPREPIVSLQQAIGRLGFKTMCDIAVAVAMRSKVFVLKGHDERLRAMWLHSAMSGTWAKEVARACRRNVEGAFLCGLLHDIGQPVVLQALLEVADGAELAPGLIDTLSREFHCEVGALVLERWKLPAWMVASVRCHHDPETAGEHVEFARTTMLADLLAHASVHPDAEADAVLKTHPVLADMGLYEDETEELFARREFVLRAADAFR